MITDFPKKIPSIFSVESIQLSSGWKHPKFLGEWTQVPLQRSRSQYQDSYTHTHNITCMYISYTEYCVGWDKNKIVWVFDRCFRTKCKFAFIIWAVRNASKIGETISSSFFFLWWRDRDNEMRRIGLYTRDKVNIVDISANLWSQQLI